MAFKATENIIGPLNIDTLPQKLNLKISYVKHIQRSKKRWTTVRRTSSAVASRCENDGIELFQMYLRAGMSDQIQKILEQQGLDILKAKFFINTKLREIKQGSSAYTRNSVPDDSGTKSLPKLTAEEGNEFLKLEKSSMLPTTRF